MNYVEFLKQNGITNAQGNYTEGNTQWCLLGQRTLIIGDLTMCQDCKGRYSCIYNHYNWARGWKTQKTYPWQSGIMVIK